MKIKINKYLKKVFFVFSLLFFVISFFTPFVINAEENIKAHLFYGEGCPHCAKEIILLNILENKYPTFSYEKYEVYFNQENIVLLDKFSEIINENIQAVPFLIVGDKYFSGFSESISTKEIEDQVKKCIDAPCEDLFYLLNKNTNEVKKNNEINKNKINEEIFLETKPDLIESPLSDNMLIKEENKEIINEKIIKKEKMVELPFLGKVDALAFSLPLLTIVMGLLDGFNPCAMWTLLFLISLLIGMKNRRRMWILGIAFIITSAFVYFLFMSAWLNLILILGFVFYFRALVGFLSILGGGYNIKKFLKKKEGSGCEVTGGEKRQKVFDNLKNIIKEKNFYLALLGIIILAFIVNLVELVCSAGLPAIYTQVLAMNDLPSYKYYGYIAFYIFFFMLDDLFVFFIAMFTLKMTGITTRYSKLSHLVGGILMVIIGFLLIFFPQFLMFG